MKVSLKKVYISLISLAVLLTPLAAPAVASAAISSTPDISSNLCAGGNLNVNDPNCSSGTDPSDKVNSLIGTVINIFSIVVGVVSVIMIIIGGLKYITSGGDSANVTGAKNTILYALVGLVIVALAQIIVRFVLQKVSTATT